MNEYFGYIRVSSTKQGHGVSLQEQRSAIELYASHERLDIVEWFEEQETAAKRGRSLFNEMLRRIKAGEATGVIIHKIDRSARNLRDWSDLADLMDAGVHVHFATGGIDMQSRGGRLSADIQAVVAADYIRNLREETRKGFYGRLKQGYYPLAAPIGYLDNGGGKAKTHDPLRAHLIKEAFQLYATGGYTLDTLCNKLRVLGLRSKGGRIIYKNRLSEILNNPFYTGLIRIRTTGETFQGCHIPLITTALYDQVQNVLHGRTSTQSKHHDFMFRRLLRCADCGYTMSGERQKGHVYYRCHTKTCRRVTIREDIANEAFEARLMALQLPETLAANIERFLPKSNKEWGLQTQKLIKGLRMQLSKDQARLEVLTDALIDRIIDKETHAQRRPKLLKKINASRQEIARLEAENVSISDRVHEFFELWKTVYSSYQTRNLTDRRSLLLITTSNRLIKGKKLVIELSEPFLTIEKMGVLQTCCHHSNNPRTLAKWMIKYAQDKYLAQVDLNYPTIND